MEKQEVPYYAKGDWYTNGNPGTEVGRGEVTRGLNTSGGSSLGNS